MLCKHYAEERTASHSIWYSPTARPTVSGGTVTAIAGRGVNLTFSITGDYPPVSPSNITWEFNDAVINVGPDTRYTFSANPLLLTISNVSLTDRGSYKLTANNRAGDNSASVILNVNGE